MVWTFEDLTLLISTVGLAASWKAYETAHLIYDVHVVEIVEVKAAGEHHQNHLHIYETTTEGAEGSDLDT